jgi:hypothetical protein
LNEKAFHFWLDEKPLICKAFRVIGLDDGSYEVLVVEVVPAPSRAGMQLELVLVTGPHKGEVVRVRAQGLCRDPVDLLGLPATLTVSKGEPELRFD